MSEEKSGLGQNIISLPEGGGAIQGLGESFSPNLFTGTGNFSVPIAVPPGRNGLQPNLAVGYSTGSPNGTFGQGWDISFPGIMRQTRLGIPQYDDEKDVFVLSGSEDLIPVGKFQETLDGVVHFRAQYRPRTEGLFAKIYHHKWSDGRNYWEVRTKEGLVTYYGNPDAIGEANTTLYDPENLENICKWSIYKTIDPFGNEVLYTYDRVVSMAPYPFTQLYCDTIFYADYMHENETKHLCSVSFNYEEREDTPSNFRHGFEIRTTLRCNEIQTFSHPLDADLPEHYASNGNDNSVLIRSYAFNYAGESQICANGISTLQSVQAIGYKNIEVDGEIETLSESLPPVEFAYNDLDFSKRDLKALDDECLPTINLNHPDLELIDLDGNGLPDFVQMSPGQQARYWKNKGQGKFERPKSMKHFPVGATLRDPEVQLMDADGDGRVDLVVNNQNSPGYYSLNFDGEWDENSFTRYRNRVPLNLAATGAKFMDLSGDGRTDVLLNGSELRCFYQNSSLFDSDDQQSNLKGFDVGWSDAQFVSKTIGSELPEIDFSDPRIRTADMTGDGLQDIVQIQDGSIVFWPNMGYGKFGKKRIMRGSPRLGYNFDPNRLFLYDIDGDGAADLMYVENNSVLIHINQSGQRWSKSYEIEGTPRLTNRDSVRIADLYGNGTTGILWSYEAGLNSKRFYFLDLTGNQKPYVMTEMRNNLGATTRVQYDYSTAFYLRDKYGKNDGNDPVSDFVGYVGDWKTKLPFPVQVVSQVEVIDEISRGKLTTRYFYHHGFWDGVEREFRGFGRVDQVDTETFFGHNENQLSLNSDFSGISIENYTPPSVTKNWFHLGPISDGGHAWTEISCDTEYWQGDLNILQRPTDMVTQMRSWSQRARRDAFRTLRGTSLRSELYGFDGSAYQLKPYTVSETQTGLKLVDTPKINPVIENFALQRNSNHIFFAYGYSSRSTNWERGDEPMTSFSFTGDIDDYGQVLSQIAIAVPYGKNPLTGQALANAGPRYNPGQGYYATKSESLYAYVDTLSQYMVNRDIKTQSKEFVNNGSASVFDVKDAMLTETTSQTWNLLGLGYNYYDGASHVGLPFAEIGLYGMPVRSESLVVTPQELSEIYPSEELPPHFNTNRVIDWSAYPQDWVSALQRDNNGYEFHAEGEGDENFVEGFYVQGESSQYDFQINPLTAKGIVEVVKDTFGQEATIVYDGYKLMPLQVTDPLGLQSSVKYDYRLFQTLEAKDPNQNCTAFRYSALGFMLSTLVLGKNDGSEGDTEEFPSVTMEYDLKAFYERQEPIFVKIIQRQHHKLANYLSNLTDDEQDAVIAAAEYSDGFGRVLQTRTQAENTLYGDSDFGDSGLLSVQNNINPGAIAYTRGVSDPENVIVSGLTRYNNKGEAVEQYEPFYDIGFGLRRTDFEGGQKVQMFYDAVGRVLRTIAPDLSESRVFFGYLNNVTDLSSFSPSPWVKYAYDANDLATEMESTADNASTLANTNVTHHFTPKSEWIDAFGRVVKTVDHNVHKVGHSDVFEDIAMEYDYDIKGQMLAVTDPEGRIVFSHKYDTAGNNLWTEHLDAGVALSFVDATSKPLSSLDAKGARTYVSHGTSHRPKSIWAKDNSSSPITLRSHSIYGDEAEYSLPVAEKIASNLLGRPVRQYDEGGFVDIAQCDFKGNPIEKIQQVLADSLFTLDGAYTHDWTGLDPAKLEGKIYQTNIEYDALNRVIESILPEGLEGRKLIRPRYNHAGALEAIEFDGTDYVKRIVYNAKGQRTLIARGNGLMTRYAYDEKMFRLIRLKSEKYTQSGQDFVPTTSQLASGDVFQDILYGHDLNGNIIQTTKKVADCGTSSAPDELINQFIYDPIKRLLNATGRESNTNINGGFWEDRPVPENPHSQNCREYRRQYTYDKVGNIRTLQHIAVGFNFTRVYQYQSGHNTLNQIEGGQTNPTIHANFVYDALGNQTQANLDRHLEWDYADQLKYFKRTDGSGNISVQANYLYSGGNRVKKITRDQQGNSDVIVYIDSVFEHRYSKSKSGSLQEEQNTTHIMNARSRIATVRTGDDFGDTSPEIKYNLDNHLGTSSMSVDTSGNLVDKEEYYPFGESSLRTFVKKRYRYVAKELDNESGLYYYGARYYSAWTCRFVSIDPLALQYAQLTPYNYAAQNPIGDLDIDGLQTLNAEIAETGEDMPQVAVGEAEVIHDNRPWYKKAWDFTKEHIVPNIPIVGGLVNAFNSFKEGDWVGGLLGLGEAVLDGVLMVTTFGVGNLVKAGVKTAAKLLLKQVVKEAGEGVVSDQATKGIDLSGVNPILAGVITGAAGILLGIDLRKKKRKNKGNSENSKPPESQPQPEFADNGVRSKDQDLSGTNKKEKSSANSRPGYRKFTSENFRENLSRLTGKKPKNSHAHHVFPQKFEERFESLGIDIHDPNFGAWWRGKAHLKHADKYNLKWEKFLKTNPSYQDVMDYGRKIMKQYSKKVNY